MRLAVIAAVALVATAAFAASAGARTPRHHSAIVALPIQTFVTSTYCTPKADVPYWRDLGDPYKITAHGYNVCMAGAVEVHPGKLFLRVCLQALDRLDGWVDNGCNGAWRGDPPYQQYYGSGFDLYARGACYPSNRGNTYRTYVSTSWFSDGIQRWAYAASTSTGMPNCP